ARGRRGARIRRGRTPVLRVLCGLASAAMLVLGGVLVVDGLRPHDPPRPPAAAAVSLPDPTADSAHPAYPAAVLGRSVPVHLDIPSIGVHTDVTQVGLNPDGTMAVPPLRRTAPAGWYRYLATPGEVGPAVIVGHVDSARDGPAVFYRLGDLRPGARITVRRADGSTAVFQVVAIAEYPKDRFPATLVYGTTNYPRLTLVTCGGSFDQAHGRYRDSIVVSAVLAGSAQR
ncbi:MAG TPA: class F sortase, partial [Rugosimonospora sp.]|nr:class F sortase [Rugosimonospora sp.]